MNEPELKAQYFYKESYVKNLWKVIVTMENVSKKTLIGVGQHKNILYDSLKLNINPTVLLLDTRLISADFWHQMRIETSQFNILFNQWRKNEKIKYSFFYQAINSKIVDKQILQAPTARQIIDGEFVFDIVLPNQLELDNKGTSQFIFSPLLTKIGYFIAVFLGGSITLVILLMLTVSPFEYYKVQQWKKKNYKNYLNYIGNKFKIDSDQYLTYREEPTELPNQYWEEFEGANFPNIWTDWEFIHYPAYKFTLTYLLLIFVDICFSLALIHLILNYP